MAFMGQPRKRRIRQRFIEVDPPSDDAPPSTDYLNEPLVSLKDALRHFLPDIDDLNKYIQLAKSTCNRSNIQGLTHDESAAIYLYTVEWDEANHQSLYIVFNRTLHSGSRSEKRRWFPYLKLLVTALRKLPSMEVNVWRILKEDVTKNYAQDKRFTWPSTTSCSRDRDEIIQTFWDLNGENTLFNISVTYGKDISAYSWFPHEQEVVPLPRSRFRVTGRSVLKNTAKLENIPVIDLQQIKF